MTGDDAEGWLRTLEHLYLRAPMTWVRSDVTMKQMGARTIAAHSGAARNLPMYYAGTGLIRMWMNGSRHTCVPLGVSVMARRTYIILSAYHYDCRIQHAVTSARYRCTAAACLPYLALPCILFVATPSDRRPCFTVRNTSMCLSQSIFLYVTPCPSSL